MVRRIRVLAMVAGLVTTGWCGGAETSGSRPYTEADAGIFPVPLLAYEGTLWGRNLGFLGFFVVTDALGRHRGQELEFSYTHQ